ncbi:tetratricopeptide repeat protein [Candidatus Latescibacterota bacterium]
MQKHRKLAAIMFTDIVGYTALMSKNEDKALRILQKNRDVVKLLVAQFNGELLKEMGDGNLCSFGSVVDAVNCALEIQNSLNDEPAFKLRIGIHVGDVVVEEGGDVFGDGVNVASRIENLAEPGGICISEQVYVNIRNKPNIDAVSLGEKSLKNVSHPLKIYCLKTSAESARGTQVIKTTEAISKSSIAVLPFVNMSVDPEQEFFCDGITEEIINALTHLEDLKVIARTSVFAFKGEKIDIREIGNKLDVELILEGSVRKDGNKLRITAQLIKVEDGSHLFSERFDREMEDVFDIQDEISLAIVDKLQIKLLKKDKAVLLKHYTADLEARKLFLQGNYYSEMLTIEGFDRAIECYKQALDKDPNYALAYTGLAMTYWYITYWGNVPPNKAYPEAKKYTKKALEIDNNLAEAHAAMGIINMNYDWNWKVAERELIQAIKLNPNSALIHTYYAFLLILTERYDEAVSEAKLASDLDPLSSYINTHVGNALFQASRFDEAIEAMLMVLKMNPNYLLAHFHLGPAYQGKSMPEEAIEEYKKAVEISNGNPMAVAFLASIYYMCGMKAKAEKLFNSLNQRSKKEYIPSTCFYFLHYCRGDQEQVFNWLERAINEHDSFLPWSRVGPFGWPKLDEERNKLLLKKMGLLE